MKMSRARRRKLQRMRNGEQLHKGQKLTTAVFAAAVVANTAVGANAATLTVLQNINSDFDYMQSHLSNIIALDQAKIYLSEAVTNAGNAENDYTEAVKQLGDAVLNYDEAVENHRLAVENVQSVREQLVEARNNRISLTKSALASQQAVAEYLPTWYEAQSILQQRVDVRDAAVINAPAGVRTARAGAAMSAADADLAAWIEQAWNEVGFENSHLSQIEDKVNGVSSTGNADADAQAQSEAAAYEEYLSDLDAQVDEAQSYFDSVSEYLDELKSYQQEAEEAEADARREVIELEMELTQAENDELAAQGDVETAYNDQREANVLRFESLVERNNTREDISDAQYALDNFGAGTGMSKSFEYYNWQGAANGHQLYNETSFYTSNGKNELSISNAYVISHTGAENGDMDGFTDTTVSAMHNNKHPLYDVRYGLDINLPTGESRTHTNASVPDFLARVTRLGEGWNFTPRLEVTRHVDKYTDWTWRTSYAFRGSYDDDYDDPNSTVNPGNIWNNELEYLHTDMTTQYMIKLQYGRTDKTSISNSTTHYNYTDGDGWTGQAYYRHWFTKKDSWGAYTNWTFDGASTYDTEDINGNGIHRLYYGAGWFHQFDEKRQMRLFANWLRSMGSSYDPITRTSHASGRRFSVSLGYDWRMDDRNSLSLDLERAVLRQEGGANYHSWGIVLGYNRSF